MTSKQQALEDDILLSAEGLSKRTTDVHEQRYAPTVSIMQRLMHGKDGLNVPLSIGGPVGGGGGDDDDDDDDSSDDDDDDDDTEFEFEQRFEEEEEIPEWPLRDVSFQLKRGEALGLVGERSAVSAVVQVLSRMTTPTSGRIVYRGRMGVSSELATLLARRWFAQPRQALKTVATLAGVPRRERKRWVRSGLILMAGNDEELTPTTLRRMRDRIAVAAALDPEATIMLLDDLPLRDTGFRERCLERVRERLADGAAAIIACRDTSIISEICERSLWLENGSVRAAGPTEPIIRDLIHARDVARRGGRGAAFNADVAILSAFATTAGGHPTHELKPGAGVRITVQFETAEPDTAVAWLVRFEGPTPTVVEQKSDMSLEEAGSYIVKLALPERDLGEGEYEVKVEAHVVTAGRRSVVQRTLARTLLASERAASQLPNLGAAELTAEWSLLDDAML